MSKETFKIFARNHPELAQSVLKDEVSWQKLYELYEIYGENSQIWDSYTSSRSFVNKVKSTSSSFKDLFNAVKNIAYRGFYCGKHVADRGVYAGYYIRDRGRNAVDGAGYEGLDAVPYVREEVFHA